ncbi:CBS domain-containing protein [Streptomyces acidicola]|uniref:CBS domain-containing protein n=1 Tax=Streptomyces acidicola TaxID=2596892 RepID=UPI0037BAF480
MLARDLAEPYPYVTTDEDATHAVRLLARHRLPALLVVDTDAKPYAVVPCAHLVGRLIPEHTTEDPPNAAVLNGRILDKTRERIEGLTVRNWLPPGSSRPPTVEHDANLTRIAVLFARTHSPLVAVVERDGDQTWLAGVVTAARLLEGLAVGES